MRGHPRVTRVCYIRHTHVPGKPQHRGLCPAKPKSAFQLGRFPVPSPFRARSGIRLPGAPGGGSADAQRRAAAPLEICAARGQGQSRLRAPEVNE